MNKATNNGLRALMQNYKSYGHPCKGKGKRQASKSRRNLGKALCNEAV